MMTLKAQSPELQQSLSLSKGTSVRGADWIGGSVSCMSCVLRHPQPARLGSN